MPKTYISTRRQVTLRSPILGRQMSQALLLTGFVVLLLTTLSFLVTRAIIEQSVLSQLSSVATVSEDSLEQTLQSHRERAILLSSHTDIRAALERGSDRSVLARLLVQLQRDEPSLVGLEVYGASGYMLDHAGEAVGLPDDARETPQYYAVTDETGWRWYDVRTPIWGDTGSKIGYIALRYDARPIVDRLSGVAPSLGSGSQVLLLRTASGELQMMLTASNGSSYILSLGQNDGINKVTMPWVSSVNGVEGVSRSIDEKGSDVLAAYRYIPALGWGMIVMANRDSALAPVRTLAFTHASIGTVLLVLAAMLAWLLARQLTQPLRSLTDRVQHLQPGSWAMHRAVHSGDEVEVLEAVLVDMAGRLQKLYQSQESEIRKRTEELREQYALDRTILDHIQYGVMTVDRRGHITAINPAALRLLGEKESAVMGKIVTEVVHICGHRGEPIKGLHPLMQSIKTRRVLQSPVSAHMNVRREDDSLMPVLYTISPFGSGPSERPFGRAGKSVAGAVMVFQDVTEERKIDYLKSEFITLASHQLRTPLSALRWYTELLADSKAHLDKDQRGYVKEMKTSVERMNMLLTSLLRASRMEGQNLQPEISDVDACALIRELEEDFVGLVREAGLQSVAVLPRHAVRLHTDPTLVRIVLQNLLSNAVKYSVKNSKKKICIELVEHASGVTINVSDEGLGIPTAEQKRIFQKFFRAKNVRKMDTDGNGLGLYITHTIVERLGGTIAFKSTENKGSVFTVTLPKKGKK